jgi:pentatricopeptide repeat protein
MRIPNYCDSKSAFCILQHEVYSDHMIYWFDFGDEGILSIDVVPHNSPMMAFCKHESMMDAEKLISQMVESEGWDIFYYEGKGTIVPMQGGE